MKPPAKCYALSQIDGAALIIVLAFVVLLAGIVVAYLSRANIDRQLENGSSNGAKSDHLAHSAIDIIVGDLKQEIVTGSTPAFDGNITIYSPTAAMNMIPQTSGTPSMAPAIPNLIRRSVQSDPIAAPGVGSRASALSSVSPSLNGRSISLARWNRHYLIPKANTGDDQTDPVSSFIPPDWVLVTRNGPKAFSSWDGSLQDMNSTNFALGRYAYAIYDEGGLLDSNIAGYPHTLSVKQSGLKVMSLLLTYPNRDSQSKW